MRIIIPFYSRSIRCCLFLLTCSQCLLKLCLQVALYLSTTHIHIYIHTHILTIHTNTYRRTYIGALLGNVLISATAKIGVKGHFSFSPSYFARHESTLFAVVMLGWSWKPPKERPVYVLTRHLLLKYISKTTPFIRIDPETLFLLNAYYFIRKPDKTGNLTP